MEYASSIYLLSLTFSLVLRFHEFRREIKVLVSFFSRLRAIPFTEASHAHLFQHGGGLLFGVFDSHCLRHAEPLVELLDVLANVLDGRAVGIVLHKSHLGDLLVLAFVLMVPVVQRFRSGRESVW